MHPRGRRCRATVDVDVAIVGAGFTGLWTALLPGRGRPVAADRRARGRGRRVRRSGRNGGWCSALFPASLRQARRRLHGSRRAARSPSTGRCAPPSTRSAGSRPRRASTPTGQGRHGRARPQPRRSWRRARGRGRARPALGPRRGRPPAARGREATAVLRGTRVRGATYTPDCAAAPPRRGWCAGWPTAVERRGVTLHERTRVTAIEPGRAVTARARCAPRSWSGRPRATPPPCRARARTSVPGLLADASPPSRCPAAVWDEIGLRRRETFSDHRHLVIYGQRTADDRLVFGGRGAPYHFGSRIRPALRPRRAGLRGAARHAGRPLPGAAAAPASPTRGAGRWASRATGARRSGSTAAPASAWAGGYVGDGVSTTNLAGRTLRDLVLGHDTELTRLPWVGHRSRRWEPEPLRWLGINAGLRAMTARRRRGGADPPPEPGGPGRGAPARIAESAQMGPQTGRVGADGPHDWPICADSATSVGPSAPTRLRRR